MLYVCIYIYMQTHTQKHVYSVSSKEVLGGPRPRPLHHTAQFAPEAAAAAIQAWEWMVVSGSGGVKLATIKTMRILYIYITYIYNVYIYNDTSICMYVYIAMSPLCLSVFISVQSICIYIYTYI